MQLEKTNRKYLGRASTTVTIGSVSLILVIGISMGSISSAQLENLIPGTSRTHPTNPLTPITPLTPLTPTTPTHPLPGSLTFLNVITNVDNSNGGTKKASDFTITVSGNSSSPRTFSGSESGTSVTLKSGS